MNRREFLKRNSMGALGVTLSAHIFAAEGVSEKFEFALTRDWLERWQASILKETRNRYCDSEMGEQLAWLIGPFQDGFYYGYMATRDISWIGRLVEWPDAWIKRGVAGPDGAVGWPKAGSGGHLEDDFYADSLMGEATALRPLVLMAMEIRKNPKLKEQFGAKAEAWVTLARRMFEKWVDRGCWREIKEGGVWVVPGFGVDQKSGKWTEGYSRRHTDGFSHPANKQNYIALWLLALFEATKKVEYKEHAEKWWRVMKSRVRSSEDGKYFVWNYWDPAGPWDFLPNGAPRHWVGVHPNGGYYQMDAEGIISAWEHGLVFTREDAQKLLATNRDFMWNQQVAGAKFQRIDGRPAKDGSGVLWPALAPYDASLRKVFVLSHDPSSWSGLDLTPWFRARLAAGLPAPL